MEEAYLVTLTAVFDLYCFSNLTLDLFLWSITLSPYEVLFPEQICCQMGKNNEKLVL